MNKKEKKKLLRIIISIILLVLAFIFSNLKIISISIYIVAYLIVGYDVVIKAIKNLFRKALLEEHFLMSLATIGAFILGDFLEAVLVMLLYQIGELFQSIAVGKSRKSITDLMNIRPDYANIKVGDNLEKVNPESVKVNDLIVVKPGEKVPLDGVIIEGHSYLDMSSLTGESIPKNFKEKDSVLSGSVNTSGLLTIKVTKVFKESTVSKILDLVENASSKKSKSENFITKFAKVYTPIVVLLAVLLATLLPILTDINLSESIHRALTFLVISCPCALVISVPLGFFGGIGSASKKGILMKGSNYLETLAKVTTIVFDKTGTLTKGVFKVNEINGSNKDKIIRLAAYAECHSNHPIGISIKEYYKKSIDSKKIRDMKEIAGFGITLKLENKKVLVGNSKLMEKEKIKVPEIDKIGTIVHVAEDNKYLGYIVISDELKTGTKEALQNLDLETIMLTGDNEVIASSIAKKLNIKKYYAELLPTDKVKVMESILENTSGKVAFVGDGINDAPVLTRVDVGIAMGGVGSDAAIESSDIVIMDDDLRKIDVARNISKKTLKIVKQNIVFAIGIKVLFLILGGLGYSNMMGSVFADVGVSVIAILNSMRTLK